MLYTKFIRTSTGKLLTDTFFFLVVIISNYILYLHSILSTFLFVFIFLKSFYKMFNILMKCTLFKKSGKNSIFHDSWKRHGGERGPK